MASYGSDDSVGSYTCSSNRRLTTSHHLRHVDSLASLPSGAGRISHLNVVILGEALASEENDLVFPSDEFCKQALVPSPQKWFKGAITNICCNCLDRNVEAGLGDKIAIYWEGNEPGYDGTLTSSELLQKVCQRANCLKNIGVKKGDAVIIYLPMLMELPIAMLAWARIGAVHSLKRGSKVINLKDIVDAALVESSGNGVSVAMTRESTKGKEGRDVLWQSGLMQRIHFFSSTPAVALENQRVFSIQLDDICYALPRHSSMRLTINQLTSTGALLTVAGLLGTVTLPMDLCSVEHLL